MSEGGENTRPSLTDAFRGRRSSGERGEAPSEPVGKAIGRGRPKTGKRSDPDYEQISALVRKDVRARFAVAQAQATVEAGRRVEFGELIEMLMAHFVAGEVDVSELQESLSRFLGEAEG